MTLEHRQNFLIRAVKDSNLLDEFFSQTEYSDAFGLDKDDFNLLKKLPHKPLKLKAKALGKKMKQIKGSWNVDDVYFAVNPEES